MASGGWCLTSPVSGSCRYSRADPLRRTNLEAMASEFPGTVSESIEGFPVPSTIGDIMALAPWFLMLRSSRPSA
jgi:hypothetical protein